MKTIKQVIKEWPEYKRLINAVIGRVGKESIMDINNYGIDGGYHGFIYYTDTHDFAMRYREDIIKLLEETAENFGEEIVKMVSDFGIFRHSKMDKDDRNDLYKYLGGGKPKQNTITNLMAWFAAEEVCRMFED